MAESDRPRTEPSPPDGSPKPKPGQNPMETPRPPIIHRPDLLVDLEKGLKPVGTTRVIETRKKT
jgi:hypothetical protein